MEPLCSTYVCGLSDEDFAAGLAILNWGLAEAERRGKRIKEAYLRGEAPERKVTPELAAKPGSGLHPIVIVIDEAHELFGDSTVGKEAGSAAQDQRNADQVQRAIRAVLVSLAIKRQRGLPALGSIAEELRVARAPILLEQLDAGAEERERRHLEPGAEQPHSAE